MVKKQKIHASLFISAVMVCFLYVCFTPQFSSAANGGLMVEQDAFWPLNYNGGESVLTTAMVHSIHRFYRRPRQPPPSPKPAPGHHTSSHGPYLTPCFNLAASPPPPIAQELVLSH